MKQRHLLSEKDVVSRNAVCSICGPVRIRDNGGRWICANKRREVTAVWQAKNRDKVNASRHTPSQHKLLMLDVGKHSGVCPVCGPVDVLPYGRGYLCGNRARELRTVQEERPMGRCWKCKTWHTGENPVTDDVCLRCSVELTPGRTLLEIPGGRQHTVESLRAATFLTECEEAGMHVGYPRDDYDLDDHQPVRGWKTIGSPLPTR